MPVSIEIYKPWELLRLAAKELQEVYHNENFTVNFDNWLYHKTDGKCHVCLAGAIMARGLPLYAKSKHADADSFEYPWDHYFFGLNNFRAGELKNFLSITCCNLRDAVIEKIVAHPENPLNEPFSFSGEPTEEEFQSLIDKLEAFAEFLESNYNHLDLVQEWEQ
jgi:hypothetical protein